MPGFKRKAEVDLVKAEDVDVKEEQSKPTTAKRPRNNELDHGGRHRYKECSREIEHGIILREYYPPEMSNERANMYGTGQIERPIESLEKASRETAQARKNVEVGECVVHWYKSDLRSQDNHALHLASEKAKKAGVPLVALYVVSPQDFRAHLTAAVRVDFILRNLKLLRKKLKDEYEIPLHVEVVEKRKNVPSRIIELCKEWRAKHLYCNMEYEVDELRREAKLTRECLSNGIALEVVHDTCVVRPGVLKTGAGGQMSVYSPWHRKWCAYLNDHAKDLEGYPPPAKNPTIESEVLSKLFEGEIPEAPKDKQLSVADRQRYEQIWPVGEEEAHSRLKKFLAERIKNYHNTRNLPGENGTSILSPHLAAGTLAARTVVREALKAAGMKKLTDNRQDGTMLWCGEVAWRDFYKHVLVHWPFVCMNKCFKPEYTDIEWEYDRENFEAWTEGRTGFPIVDAAMRQCHHMAYIHNRCRMIVASFMTKDLMLDWRMGERWFMEHLIDGDFASNNGGWGFSASCGVDPQPYFRIFNPLLQSEKFDASGDYIRKWIPELRDIKDKAIHDPYGRGAGAIAKKNGYPKPIVDHKFARERALTRYKAGLKRSTA